MGRQDLFVFPIRNAQIRKIKSETATFRHFFFQRDFQMEKACIHASTQEDDAIERRSISKETGEKEKKG